MGKLFRIPLVWGLLCFALLYRTFPADVIYSWQAYYQYQGHYSQLLVSWILQLVPPLLPLLCFIVFYKKKITLKGIVLFTPFLLWLASKLLIAVIIYGIALKVGSIDFISENLSSIIKRLYTLDWFLASLTYGLTIVACSYAFWREVNTVNRYPE